MEKQKKFQLNLLNWENLLTEESNKTDPELDRKHKEQNPDRVCSGNKLDRVAPLITDPPPRSFTLCFTVWE